MQNIKYFRLQKMLWFIPILNFLNFFIWVINMIYFRKKVNQVMQSLIIFLSFIAGFFCWRFLSIACTICTGYIDNPIVDNICIFVYYYLTGILITSVFIISEKKISAHIKYDSK